MDRDLEARKGHERTKLMKIKTDCIRVTLKNVGPVLFYFSQVYLREGGTFFTSEGGGVGGLTSDLKWGD